MYRVLEYIHFIFHMPIRVLYIVSIYGLHVYIALYVYMNIPCISISTHFKHMYMTCIQQDWMSFITSVEERDPSNADSTIFL